MFFKLNELLRFNDVRPISSGHLFRLRFSAKHGFFYVDDSLYFGKKTNFSPHYLLVQSGFPFSTRTLRVLQNERSKRSVIVNVRSECTYALSSRVNRSVRRSNLVFMHCSCTLNTRQHPVNRRRHLGRHNFSGSPKVNTRC